jgi:hypothetical protein
MSRETPANSRKPPQWGNTTERRGPRFQGFPSPTSGEARTTPERQLQPPPAGMVARRDAPDDGPAAVWAPVRLGCQDRVGGRQATLAPRARWLPGLLPKPFAVGLFGHPLGSVQFRSPGHLGGRYVVRLAWGRFSHPSRASPSPHRPPGVVIPSTPQGPANPLPVGIVP